MELDPPARLQAVVGTLNDFSGVGEARENETEVNLVEGGHLREYPRLFQSRLE
jgi:hypothetical protein